MITTKGCWKEKSACIAIGSAFIEEIGSNSSLFELASLPLLFRELVDDYIHPFFFPYGTQVFGCGNNDYGQLGLAYQMNGKIPNNLPFLSGFRIIKICCGDKHSMDLLESGEVLTWGLNNYGQLGFDELSQILQPTETRPLSGRNIVDIACGSFHSMALTHEGIVYTFGANTFGQLGYSVNAKQSTPAQILTLQGIKVSQIFSGSYQSFALLENDTVYAFGKNDNGQLGTGDFKYRPEPTHIPSLSNKHIISISTNYKKSLALTNSGQVYFAGDKDFSVPEVIQGFWHCSHNWSTTHEVPRNGVNICSFTIISEIADKRIISIAAGSLHCLALQDNGDVLSWGENSFGDLGLGSVPNTQIPTIIPTLAGKRVKKIACERSHSIALTDSGDVFSWGWNPYGKLGLGDTATRLIPEQITRLKDKDIVNVYCGNSYSMFLIR